jgi:hypothetical protein
VQNIKVVVERHSDIENGAYLCAIASLGTADGEVSPEEKEYSVALCEAANLSAPLGTGCH